jgi:RNA polymerase sigma-70 factor (ECF subfamily)
MAQPKKQSRAKTRTTEPPAWGELVAAARRGDPTALSQLLVLLQPRLLAMARRRLGNEADALDVLQDVLLKIVKKLPEFDPARACVTHWAARICRNEIVDLVRKRRRRGEVPLEGAAFSCAGGDPSDSAEAEELQTVLRAAVNELPQNQRVAVTLRFLDEMTYKEAARAAEVPLGTLAGWTFRGLVSLRYQLRRAG